MIMSQVHEIIMIGDIVQDVHNRRIFLFLMCSLPKDLTNSSDL